MNASSGVLATATAGIGGHGDRAPPTALILFRDDPSVEDQTERLGDREVPQCIACGVTPDDRYRRTLELLVRLATSPSTPGAESGAESRPRECRCH